MKHHCIFILLILLCTARSFAQLKIYPLTHDPKRNIQQINKKDFAGFRMALVDSIKPGVSIRLLQGINPRCSNTQITLKFEAIAVNGGANPVFDWLVDGNLVSSNAAQYTSSSLSVGQKVICRLTSSLDCASPKTVLSDTFKITSADTLLPSISIYSINGAKDACDAATPVTFVGVILNGGNAPQIKLFYNNVEQTGVTSLIWAKDSMADKGLIQATLKSDLSCRIIDTAVRSNVIRRNIYKNLINSVSVKLESITNDDCGQRQFNFSAVPLYGGSHPLYQWYVNGIRSDSSYTGLFSTGLEENGDEVKVVMLSSLYCANPQNIVSDNYFQRTDTIQLPLFDDFSTSTGTPSKNLWVKNGGTYINNTYAFDPPSYNTATFDGLEYNGLLYDSVGTSSRGVTDNLTSLPINLSSSTNESNIYLSFYWQPQGLGDAPESAQNDNLSLYFKNISGSWIRVWQQPGDTLHPFKQAIIAVANDTSNIFLHSGFQFRFESSGRLSGSFDIWNVDYIYLNQNRNPADTFFLDQTFSRQPSSILKKYSAMPYKQFKGHQNKELKDSISTTINNLSKFYNNITYGAKLMVQDSILSEVLIRDTTIIFPGEIKNREILSSRHDSISIAAPGNRMEIKSIFQLSGDRDNTIDNKFIPYTINNTITGLTILDNFYAYDDGSAEYGIGINQNSGLVAYRFQVNTPDTLTQIGFYFTRLGGVLVDQTINIFITKTRPTRLELNKIIPPDNILYNENKLIKYENIINNFTLYRLETPIVVTDTFYVGYKQFSDQKLAIGWDVNTDASENMFYNLNDNWQPYTETKGSMMIRPIFGEYRYLLDTKPVINIPELIIYPNPSTGSLNIEGKYDYMSLFDLQGTEKYASSYKESFNLDFLTPGLYIMKFITGQAVQYKKILIQK